MAAANQGSVPTISLITVCRNSAATLGEAIASVIAQKGPGVEYLVIDGASTDTTHDVIGSWRQDIDVFISEPDAGIADAFNKGIRLAAGEIIGLINADDTLAPGAVEKVRRFFVDHPDTEVLHGDVLLFSPSRRDKRLTPPARWWYPWRLVLFNHPATFVRKSVYAKHGLFDTSYHIAMDAEIFLRWQSSGVRIRYFPEILAHMRAGGISGQRAAAGYRQVRNALIRHGFPSSVAYVQYWGKVTLGALLQMAAWRRRKPQAMGWTESVK